MIFGNMQFTNKSTITPEASGSVRVGTKSQAMASGVFDVVVANAVYASGVTVSGGGIGGPLGTWYTKDTQGNDFSTSYVYQAQSDGFVVNGATTSQYASVSWGDSAGSLTYTEYNYGQTNAYCSVTIPIRKNQYWQVGGTRRILWIPMGQDLTCIKQ